MFSSRPISAGTHDATAASDVLGLGPLSESSNSEFSVASEHSPLATTVAAAGSRGGPPGARASESSVVLDVRDWEYHESWGEVSEDADFGAWDGPHSVDPSRAMGRAEPAVLGKAAGDWEMPDDDVVWDLGAGDPQQDGDLQQGADAQESVASVSWSGVEWGWAPQASCSQSSGDAREPQVEPAALCAVRLSSGGARSSGSNGMAPLTVHLEDSASCFVESSSEPKVYARAQYVAAGIVPHAGYDSAPAKRRNYTVLSPACCVACGFCMLMAYTALLILVGR
mmetsp:Transcript_59096/g.127259  ORF Transcript_59096/g.127259 Transcript_59096/m.127259 type:complete len:282 (+) Transcript_59096:143-988(+)|eukprot:CAMPEP_0204481162 /NCGR_PEP_ID=MMETSP0471-20130131/46146_1 /ASSEMBLY_ACC=CAM_ASM_000602 /TAXON_ID=2969 /ORGANISM="Oxyrrhis marina" /LENGTH=281 /DNA_ID=CAMNT_0051484287 /DNA_START=130 /DNA_END=975 /DNA_ORIENTATION=+